MGSPVDRSWSSADLQDHHRRRLVDLLSALAGTGLRRRRDQAAGRRDGGQPLVHQAYRHRRRPERPRARRSPCAATAAGPSVAVQRPGQPDHHLDRLPLARPARAAPRGRLPPWTSRRSVSTGLASIAEPSLAATPTRTDPTSTPIRTPGLISCRPGRSGCAYGLERGVDLGRVGAAALGEVVLAAAATAEHTGADADQVAGLDAAGARPRR